MVLKKPKVEKEVSFRLPKPFSCTPSNPVFRLQIIRNVALTEIKDRVGQAIVAILKTKETFHSAFFSFHVNLF